MWVRAGGWGRLVALGGARGAVGKLTVCCGVVCGCGGLGWWGVQLQVQAGAAKCDAVAAAFNTFEGVTGMYCDYHEWLTFSSNSKCEAAKNQLNTFSGVDLDCGGVSPHALRNAASST